MVDEVAYVKAEWLPSRNGRPAISLFEGDASADKNGPAAHFLDRIGQFFASANSEPPADSFLLWFSGLGSSDDGKLCCEGGTYITFEQVIVLWEGSAACQRGHRLVLCIDASYSGHWAIKASQRCLQNVVVQTSCSSEQQAVNGVFTKAFIGFQNSGGSSRPSPNQLHARTPLVYVPWSSEIAPVIHCNSGGRQPPTPYLRLLSAPEHTFHAAPPMSQDEVLALLRSMDQLLRCDDMRVADVVAALPLGRGRKENLLSQIKKWRQDPLAAIAFLSSAASAPLAPSSMLYNGYIYASAHLHPFNHAVVIEDGKHFVDIVDAEFEIAPGDENDIKVTNMYPWGSEWLVFGDGTAAATALAITHIPSLSGSKGGNGGLKRDGAKVRSHDSVDDILLRKRA